MVQFEELLSLPPSLVVDDDDEEAATAEEEEDRMFLFVKGLGLLVSLDTPEALVSSSEGTIAGDKSDAGNIGRVVAFEPVVVVVF